LKEANNRQNTYIMMQASELTIPVFCVDVMSGVGDEDFTATLTALCEK